MELIVRYKFYDFVSIIEYETVFNDFETEDSFYIKLFEMFNQISKHIRKHELFPYYKTYTNGVIFDNQNNVKENGHETLACIAEDIAYRVFKINQYSLFDMVFEIFENLNINQDFIEFEWVS